MKRFISIEMEEPGTAIPGSLFFAQPAAILSLGLRPEIDQPMQR
jgi:hypothetical protein